MRPVQEIVGLRRATYGLRTGYVRATLRATSKRLHGNLHTGGPTAHARSRLKPFLHKIKSFKEVVNCYRITGNENIVMEVIFKDQLHLEKFIDELISYGETKPQIILSEVISSQEIRKISR